MLFIEGNTEDGFCNLKRKIRIKRILIASVALILSVLIAVGCLNIACFNQKTIIKLAKAFGKTHSEKSFVVRGEFQMTEIPIPLLGYDFDYDMQFEMVNLNDKGQFASATVCGNDTHLSYYSDGYSAEWNDKKGSIQKDLWVVQDYENRKTAIEKVAALIFKDYQFLAEDINNNLKKDIFDPSGFDECLEVLLPNLMDDEYVQKHLKLTEIEKDGFTVITSEFKMEELLRHCLDILSDSDSAFKHQEDYDACVQTLDNIQRIIESLETSVDVKAEFYINSKGYIEKIKAIGKYLLAEQEKEFSLNMEYFDFGTAVIPRNLTDAFNEKRRQLGDGLYAHWDKNGFYISDKP